ncbi:crossover junction endodeoxyribonuclease RuvC [Commensalibacter oyaizuii]|uniref:Crossover junction endodeoxyribonuclease RuvC n=1 Tax=Commensalibacter oyaizuii TaxID=3043873 RepID=A0ABT6PYD1_9PROT|nr:crossover junction endodeoxyribonuclease RuvC [Commensalibacter sp. TBRC 16381]MDI2089867.1 crossover junction endodeoxyribonuclease RuvC [Commensalibacter sp. TBRC 16381]
MVRIIGIDPGLRFTGWGVIDAQGNRLSYVASGVLASDSKMAVPERLCVLSNGLEGLINQYSPDEAAVEETYVNQNGTATLKLGYARGVALLVPAKSGLLVIEYGAKTVKRAVVGTGAATKDQVTMMIKRLLPTATIPRADAADALAIAICHAHHRTSQNFVAAGKVMA